MKNLLMILLVMASGFSAAQASELSLYCEAAGDREKVVDFHMDGIIEPFGDREVGAFSDGFLPVGPGYYVTMRNVTDLFFDIRKHTEYQLTQVNDSRFAFVDLIEGIAYSCDKRGEDDALPVTKIFEGRLTSVFAIGGETTGIGMATTAGGFLELDGETNEIRTKLYSSFGTEMMVEGYFESRMGIEIPVREVFIVTEILD